MKKHFTVTISGLSGSHHYTSHRSIIWRSALAVMLVLAGVVASLHHNYRQYGEAQTQHSKTAAVKQELARVKSVNATLNREIAEYDQRMWKMAEELREIEEVIGLHTTPWGSGEEQVEPNLRMEEAVLSTYQQKVLHRTIPNGFPTTAKIITSVFGPRVHPVTRKTTTHKGIDIRARKNTKVYSTADGIVRTANYSKFSGNRVIIQHNFGFSSYFAHLSKMKVRAGDVIQRGDLIGLSGDSGQSAGPHLHYEVRYLGKPLNPADFLNWEFGSHEIFTQVKVIKWPSLINLINKQITPATLRLSQLGVNSPGRLK